MTSFLISTNIQSQLNAKMDVTISEKQDENIKITPTSKCTEQRAVIKHCVKVGMSPTDTLKFIKMDKSVKFSHAYLFKWHKRFREGE